MNLLHVIAVAGFVLAVLCVGYIVTRPVQAAGLTRSAPPVHHVDRQNSERSQ